MKIKKIKKNKSIEKKFLLKKKINLINKKLTIN